MKSKQVRFDQKSVRTDQAVTTKTTFRGGFQRHMATFLSMNEFNLSPGRSADHVIEDTQSSRSFYPQKLRSRKLDWLWLLEKKNKKKNPDIELLKSEELKM